MIGVVGAEIVWLKADPELARMAESKVHLDVNFATFTFSRKLEQKR